MTQALPGPTILSTLATLSVPLLRVSGLELEERGRLDVELVLDWGDLALSGRVLDDGGDPVRGADVRLSWADRRGRINSTSFRRTVSDGEGRFRFAQLGRTEHRLEIRAEGYEIGRQSYEPSAAGREVEVRLQRASR